MRPPPLPPDRGHRGTCLREPRSGHRQLCMLTTVQPLQPPSRHLPPHLPQQPQAQPQPPRAPQPPPRLPMWNRKVRRSQRRAPRQRHPLQHPWKMPPLLLLRLCHRLLHYLPLPLPPLLSLVAPRSQVAARTRRPCLPRVWMVTMKIYTVLPHLLADSTGTGLAAEKLQCSRVQGAPPDGRGARARRWTGRVLPTSANAAAFGWPRSRPEQILTTH